MGLWEEITEGEAIPQVAWFATVASNPTDYADKIDIIIPDLDPEKRWTDCRWQARDSTSLPIRGNVCLAIFDNNNEIWVVAWWPFT